MDLTWDAAAERLAGAFREALRMPPRLSLPGGAPGADGSDGVDSAVLLDQLLTSTSWRVTAPLRRTNVLARKVRNRLR